MRSIKKTTSNIIKIYYLLFLIMTIFLLIFFKQDNDITILRKNYTEVVSKTNQTISSLYKIRDSYSDNIYENEFYKEIKNNSENIISDIRNYDFIKFEGVSLEKTLKFTEKEISDVSEVITELGNNIKIISSFINNKIENTFNFQKYFFILFFIFSFALLIIVNIIKNFNYNFYETISENLQKTEKLMNFENTDFNENVKWVEEKKYLDIFNNLKKDLMFSNKYLDLGIYGSLEKLLPEIQKTIQISMPADRIGVAFLDSFGNVIAETTYSKSKKVFLGIGFSQKIDETSLGKIVDSESSYRIINDLEYHLRSTKSKSTALIVKEGFKSNLTLPIYLGNECVGFLFISSFEKNSYTEKHGIIGKKIMNLIKQNLYNHYIVQQLVASISGGLVKLVEGRDNETGNHIRRVSVYSKIIAEELSENNKKINPKFIRELYWFAPLHDIGKVGIADAILLKPGRLTSEEFEIMKNHVNIGAGIIEEINKSLKNIKDYHLLDIAKDVILGHHEKYDGTGYPYGLSKEEIPLAGRIVAVADVFDALCSKRPYKEPFTFEESVEIIEKSSGKHFDPVVAGAFLNNIDKIKEIYTEYKD